MADGHDPVPFSNPVATNLDRNGLYLTCRIGQFVFPSGPHVWKMHLRAEGTHLVSLAVVASLVNSGERGAIEAAVRDEEGAQTVSVEFDSTGDSLEELPLLLDGWKVYDLSVSWLDPNGASQQGHHYRLGSRDTRLELGWAGPLEYLEPRASLAINVDGGESLSIELLPQTLDDGTPAQHT